MELSFSLVFAALTTMLVIVGMISDVQRYRIPNWVNGLLLLLYPVGYFLIGAPMDWQQALLAFVVVFPIGYIVYALRAMGAGDIKMLSVLALWVELSMTLAYFILYVAAAGGMMTIILLMLRKYAPYYMMKWFDGKRDIPQVLSDGQPLPYGVAIGVVFIWMLWAGQFPFFNPGQ